MRKGCIYLELDQVHDGGAVPEPPCGGFLFFVSDFAPCDPSLRNLQRSNKTKAIREKPQRIMIS